MELNEELEKYPNVTSILFPGIIKNHNKAVEHLGGNRSIYKAVSNSLHKRIGLSFHPDNMLAKKTYADRQRRPGLLVKVKIKKKKQESGQYKKEIVSTNVVGISEFEYIFENMMDFQYMPLHNDRAGEKPRCLYNDIVPTGIEKFNWLEKDVIQLPVPAVISRNEKQISYFDKLYKLNDDEDQTDEIVMAQTFNRCKALNKISYGFKDQLPTEADPQFLTRAEAKRSTCPEYVEYEERVKKIFEERPIWSKNAIVYYTKIPTFFLKIILPCYGLYYNSGPWHLLWVKFGYDPRKHPEAKMYQVFEMRYQYAIVKKDMKITQGSIHELVEECWFKLKPGCMPHRRQAFYQLCDLNLPEVESYLASLPEVLPGTLCNERRGWLPPGALEQIKRFVTKYYKSCLGINLPKDENSDSSSSDSSGEEPDKADEVEMEVDS